MLLLGYPEAALADTERALKIARDSAHAATLIYVLNFSVSTHVLCGHLETANALIDEFIPLKDQIGSVSWDGWGTGHRGCVLAVTGKAAEAVQDLASGIAANAINRKHDVDACVPVLSGAEPRQTSVNSTQPGPISDEAMSAVETTKENGTKPRSIALPEKSRCLRTKPDVARRKPISPARSRLRGSSRRNLGAPSRNEHWRASCCAQGRRQPAPRAFSLRSWLVHPGFDTLDLARGQAVARGTGAMTSRI